MPAVLALSLDTAKNIAIIAVSALLALAVASFWIMKTAAQKIAVMAILGLLAALAWSQRAALEDCADRVTADLVSGDPTDPTCTFFGQEISINSPDRP